MPHNKAWSSGNSRSEVMPLFTNSVKCLCVSQTGNKTQYNTRRRRRIEEAESATIFPRRVRKKKKNLTRKLPKWTSLPPSPLFGIVNRNERRNFGNVIPEEISLHMAYFTFEFLCYQLPLTPAIEGRCTDLIFVE